MNILYVTHESDLNGASLSLLALIDELKGRHNIFLLTCSKSGQFVDELKRRNVNYLYTPYWRWMANNNCSWVRWHIKRFVYLFLGLINNVSAFGVGGFLKKNQIDIIHSNSSVVNIGGILSRIYRIPHVWHIREFGQEDFDLEFIYKNNNCLKFMNLYSCSIVCISGAIFQKYAKFFDDKKCRLIYNGLPKEYLRKKNPRERSFFNFLIAGRLEEAKGQRDAIMAMNNIFKQGLRNFKLYIAGSGPLDDELKNLVKILGLGDCIEFCGKISDLNNLRKIIDVEFVCSRSEAFGRVTIESMMSSNPVIGANTGATKELIVDGFNGYLYEQGNHEDMSSKIIKIMSNNIKFNEMSKNAYFFSKQNFSSKINSEKIYNLYNEITSGECHLK